MLSPEMKILLKKLNGQFGNMVFEGRTIDVLKHPEIIERAIVFRKGTLVADCMWPRGFHLQLSFKVENGKIVNAVVGHWFYPWNMDVPLTPSNKISPKMFESVIELIEEVANAGRYSDEDEDEQHATKRP